ncbi:MAG: PAS domain-containing sensor histidine kinase [Bacteroidota bacterium]
MKTNYQIVRREDELNADERKFLSLITTLKGYEEYILDETGIIISSNLEAVNITGYDEWEVLGKHFSLLYSSSQIESSLPEKNLKETFISGSYQATAMKVKKKKIPFLANIQIVKLANSQTGVYKLVLSDSTHKAILSQRLQSLKNKYFPFFNNTYTGIFRFQLSDGLVTLANNKAIEIFGREVESNFNLKSIFFSDEQYHEFVDSLKAQGELHEYEFQVCQECGKNRWVSISCQAFFNEDYAEGVLLDITERKNQVLELERLNDELDRFIYHASHDLRAPLTSILGLANLMELENDVNSTYGSLIKERVEHLDELLRELVELTRNNKTELQIDLIDFKADINTILDEISNPNNVQIDVHIDSELPFYSDAVRLKTIIRNLISNAVKYYDGEKDDPYVKFSVKRKLDSVELTISDNGIGIDNDSIKRLFTMFFRATSNASGSGLGLFIVKAMLGKLGGTIQVESELEVGTTFTIQLPNNHQ